MGREFRKFERKALGYPSNLLVEGCMFPCHIIDVSAGGARLYVEDHTRVPDQFTLLLSAMGAKREVTVMWRHASAMGVRFETAANKSAAPRQQQAGGKYLV